jgi:chemotaxis protein CheC
MNMTDDLKDALKELINISFGSATASIAELFDSFATLHIPEIEIINLSEIQKKILRYYDFDELALVTQNFNGGFSGETLFLSDLENSKKIKNIVFDDFESEEYSQEDMNEALLEISNILGVTCVGKLAELLNSDIMFYPPSVKYVNERNILLNVNEEYKKVIFIDTILEFKDLDISSNLFILMTERSFLWLEESLNKFLEDF